MQIDAVAMDVIVVGALSLFLSAVGLALSALAWWKLRRLGDIQKYGVVGNEGSPERIQYFRDIEFLQSDAMSYNILVFLASGAALIGSIWAYFASLPEQRYLAGPVFAIVGMGSIGAFMLIPMATAVVRVCRWDKRPLRHTLETGQLPQS